MNKYQKALDTIEKTEIIWEYYYDEVKTLQELVDKATILQDENVQKLLKTFIPIDEPYCSNCMFYTESNCDKKDNCYLSKFIKAIDWSNND